jgi:hypothetical protein
LKQAEIHDTDRTVGEISRNTSGPPGDRLTGSSFRKILWPLLALCVLVSASCRKDSSNPIAGAPYGYTDNFRLRIEAKSADGMPVPGLVVSAWSHMNIRLWSHAAGKKASHDAPGSVMKDLSLARPRRTLFNPFTSIPLQLPKGSRAFPRVRDLKDAPRFPGLFTLPGMVMATASGLDSVVPSPVVPKDFLVGWPYPNPFNPTTVIRYQLPRTARVCMAILDLRNIVVDTLIPAHPYEAGVYEIIFDGSGFPPGVYTVSLLATDTVSGKTLYAQSVLAVLVAGPDGLQTIIGSTAGDGSFETANSLLFPGLFTLPDIVETSAEGDSLGLLRFKDTVTIVLSDMAAHTQVSYDRVLVNGANTYKLLWNPPGVTEEHIIGR